MLDDLGFSETIYGLGAGMFFIGYLLFEVPSNVILHRVGARLWIGRIMISWGLVSAAFMFVTSPTMFYALRFLLGVAEAGFYPGIILYLTYWFPSYRRARVIALFMTAIPVSGILGGPLSGWIMETFAGLHGLAGWQWLFVIEAMPAIVLGVATIWYLDDGIRSARWLNADEKRLLEDRLREDSVGVVQDRSVWSILADRRIWHLSAIYFCAAMGQYGLTFWLPALLQSAGATRRARDRPPDRDPLLGRRRRDAALRAKRRPAPGTPLARGDAVPHRRGGPLADGAGRHAHGPRGRVPLDCRHRDPQLPHRSSGDCRRRSSAAPPRPRASRRSTRLEISAASSRPTSSAGSATRRRARPTGMYVIVVVLLLGAAGILMVPKGLVSK